MNIPETEIENLLRAAPKPKPPAGLKARLIAELQLPPVGQASRLPSGRLARETTTSGETPGKAGGTPAPLPRGGWLRRWWPALAPATVSLACAVVFTMQQLEINDLKETIRVLSPDAITTEASPSTPPDSTSDIAPAVDASASEQAEIARLKAVASQLTTAVAQLEQIRVENKNLRARLATPPAGYLTSEETDALTKARDRAQSVTCVNNLKQLGLAARVWAIDNNDRYPEDIISMTNEMSTPKILWCPADTAHQAVSGWAEYTAANCSYDYLAASANDGEEPTRVLFRCQIHGNIGLCDGSVQMGVGKSHPEWLVLRDGKLFLDMGRVYPQQPTPVPNNTPTPNDSNP